ncbi:MULTISPECIES: CsbD family protein [Micrococcaceae]|uniref:CsbD family protein n=1 Tax=Micrococcaceae TaxID=1268 RepID=UPI0010359446|nr:MULTISPECIES: CsbD family protein [Micrococcaceae]TAP28142.1 CsbD family protein [Arthrobacter sp. S41]UXN33054.1 CsbD family protein [Glutamicibacter sp. M10]
MGFLDDAKKKLGEAVESAKEFAGEATENIKDFAADAQEKIGEKVDEFKGDNTDGPSDKV